MDNRLAAYTGGVLMEKLPIILLMQAAEVQIQQLIRVN